MSKKEKVIIFGTGPFAEVVHFFLENDSFYEVVGFTANKEYIKNDNFLNLPLIAYEEISNLFPPNKCKMFIAIGYNKVNRIRAARYFDAKSKGYDLITYISSKASYYNTPVGKNSFIMEDNTIQPFSKIGNNVILWSGNHIGHHSTIKDHCFISSHVVVSGNVEIDENTFIGVNATIRDSIKIGKFCVIGAGAQIMKSMTDKQVYVSKSSELYSKNSDEIRL